LLALTLGLGVYFGRTWPLPREPLRRRFPTAAALLAFLAWAGVFLPWFPAGGRTVRGIETFLRIGEVDLSYLFLLIAAAAVFFEHVLGALLQARMFLITALVPAIYGVAHAALFLIAILQQRGEPELGLPLTLGAFILLLALTAALTARR